ncbi:MAG: flavin monoamine oxidase family protein [Steroidobacteraceae bacterium]
MSRAPRMIDVAVLGAGAAGLAAAAALTERGLAVSVVEARERVGGRIFTLADPSLDWPIELGAEFIHGRAPATRALLEQSGGIAIDTAGARWTLREGRPTPREDVFAGMQQLMRRVESLPDEDLSVEEFLTREARDPSLEAACTHARMMVEGFDAADPRRASVRAIANEWSGMDGGQGRPSGGYGELTTHLARSLVAGGGQLHLQSVLRRVQWRAGAVTVIADTPAGPLELAARCALVALPVSVLKRPSAEPDGVWFAPPLEEKAAALRGVEVGPVVKVVLRFRRAFWEEMHGGRFRDAGFLHSPEAPFRTIWTALPTRMPLLTAWAGGPRAVELAGSSRDELIESALVSVRSVLGAGPEVRDELTAAYAHDWLRDRHAQGAYSYITVGGCGAPAELARPLRDTLYFAGEAANPGESGTVEAALQSGRRAAHEIAKQFAK